MQIRANELHKALCGLGRVPKTFRVQCVCTDLVTGKQYKGREKSDYAVVRITLDGRSVNVDYYALKQYVKTLRKSILDVKAYGNLSILYTRPNGTQTGLSLENIWATPAVELVLDSMCELV